MSRPAASTTAIAPTATVDPTIGINGSAWLCNSGSSASIQPSGDVQRTHRRLVPLSAIMRSTNAIPSTAAPSPAAWRRVAAS